jgi:crotonobetainyl-CoA:carnitine CoA-transferase CaiB-like acyl-CoA transferase
MSGFGQSGPYAERPAMDPVLQAFSGFMAENRDSTGRPMNIASIPVDMITALYAFQALSAALYARRDEPRGRYIEASLMQGAAWLNTYALLQRLIYNGDPPGAKTPRSVYPTADGWILVIVAGRRGWGDFCAALEQPALAEDPRFTRVKLRAANYTALVPILNEVLSQRPNAHWQKRFAEYGVMHAVANESIDLLRDPHVQATGLFSYLAQPGLALPMPIPGIPGAPALQSGTKAGTAPLAGADTDAILAAHGYGASDIADLRRRGIVAGPR